MAACEVCLRTVPRVRRCTRCLAVWYCSPECQKQDWPLHKSSCDTASRAAQAASGGKFVPRATELEATERQATSSGDPSADGDPSVSDNPSTSGDPSASGDPPVSDNPSTSGDPSVSDNPSASGDPSANGDPSASGDPPVSDNPSTSGGPSADSDPSVSDNPSACGDPSATGGSRTYLQCYKCGKREAEMKKCGKCKKVTYCSRDCQRQHWATHKSACAVLSFGVDNQRAAAAENGFGQMESQVFEELVRRMALAFEQHPVHPLTLLMWMQVKQRVVLRYPGDQVVERFSILQSDMPWISPSPRRVVLLCLIQDIHPFISCIIVEDIEGFRRLVVFNFEEEPEPYFRYEQIRRGNFLCLENALFHMFENGIFGFQIEDPSLVHIIEMM